MNAHCLSTLHPRIVCLPIVACRNRLPSLPAVAIHRPHASKATAATLPASDTWYVAVSWLPSTADRSMLSLLDRLLYFTITEPSEPPDSSS